MRKLIWTIALACAITTGFGQQVLTEQEAISEANLSFQIGDYLEVHTLLQPWSESIRSKPDVLFQFGVSCYNLNAYHEKGFKIIEEAYQLGVKEAAFYYGNYLLERNRLSEALKVARTMDSSDKRMKLESHINNALYYIARPEPVWIEHLGDAVNSEYSEHTPIIGRNDSIIYFTSHRPFSEKSIQDLAGLYDENIYFSTREKKGWSPAQALPGSINKDLNESVVWRNEDEMLVFKTSRDLTSSDLWHAHRKGDEWKLSSRLKQPINSKWSEKGATKNQNGNVIIFSSDRPGGFGGFDLYRVVEFGNGKLSLPVNLGPDINSSHDEISPFLLYDDKTLFFASDRPESMGGFDIFYSVQVDDSTYERPSNLGYPINTSGDDAHMTVSGNGKSGYYARSRSTNRADFDIYKCNLPGFNIRATVFRIRFELEESKDLENAEIALFTEDFSQLKGIYTPNRHDRIVVVLMPNESGILGVDLPGYESVEQELSFISAQDIIERELVIKLTKNTE